MADVGFRSSVLDTAGSDDSTVLSPNYSIPQRLKCAVMVFVIQKILLTPLHLYDRLHDFLLRKNESRPSLTKSYKARPSLPVRIFLPRGHGALKSNERLPTLLTIHGGGFVVGYPRDNDAWNSAFANHHNFLVIALNYAKAPTSPFPGPIYDLEAIIGAVLSDSSLPIDPSRVALAGWSAGGNLALAVSQLESVRTRIRAVVPIYPVVDFVAPAEIKARTRRFKPSVGGFRARESDHLLALTDMFSWAYVNPGLRCDHALLSPYYASRESFPRSVFLIGCEMDILGQEAWRMACKLAGREVPAVEEPMGREEPAGKGELILHGDERFAFEERLDLLMDPELMEDARIKTEKVISLVGEWLYAGPFKEVEK
ncbi:Alpha/Beta hydrolase protein [Cercophora newfieldiana]|uniref:Alpha/Beta hydrolase protein n=1 Tax=Cercophora newfieldiana TaxID=92897 RepID=A0AA40CKA1_9PEZI|nr:Alpha/Beta hydrolase protein [Cercophora newfieldiana]